MPILFEYVKICSLYGVGYYYIPGTDTCIKIGGYVRYEAYHNYAGGSTGSTYPTTGTNGAFTRQTNTFGQQARFRLSADVRTQTEYGTLRSYFAFGANAFTTNTGQNSLPVADSVSMERAFIQFAGFTIGRADTFYAIYNGAAYGLVNFALDPSSGPAGRNVFAYTWQFGNGLSASLSVEDPGGPAKPVLDLNVASSLLGASFGAAQGNDYGGQKVPDIVGNLRVDQAWGSAQIMGALHQVTARYYNTFPAPGCAGGGGNVTGCDNPSDKWGWSVGTGMTLKMPWDPKDTLSGTISYAKGASGYVAASGASQWLHKQGVSVGPLSDAVFAQPNSLVAGYDGSLQLTEAWGGTLAFEHYWTPSLRTSFVGGYLNVSYNDTAKALIQANNCAAANAALTNTSSCDPDWSMWRFASRTMWNPVANLDVGVEIAYTKIDTAFAGTANVTGSTGLATGTYAIEDQGVWSAALRVQRSFWP